MNREERAAKWLYGGLNALRSPSLETLAESEEETDVCFIENHGCRESPLGFCCTKKNVFGKRALRVLLERGADPTKDARRLFFGAELLGVNGFVVAAVQNNIEAFVMMLDYAKYSGFTLDTHWGTWIDRHSLRNRSKTALVWALRYQMQREDLVEPVLHRVATFSLFEWCSVK